MSTAFSEEGKSVHTAAAGVNNQNGNFGDSETLWSEHSRRRGQAMERQCIPLSVRQSVPAVLKEFTPVASSSSDDMIKVTGFHLLTTPNQSLYPRHSLLSYALFGLAGISCGLRPDLA